MTEQQFRLFRILWAHRYNPVARSFVELAEEIGLKSKSSIMRLLRGLEEQGYIRRLPNRARTIELTGKLPLGFRDAEVHEMWALETDHFIQPHSLRISRQDCEKMPGQDRLLASQNPKLRRVRVTIERID